MDKYSDLISIVVPVYNVEKYLIPCIDSILKQTYKYFELIIVDDGSTDCSGELCNNYIGKDKRIKVFHKNNGGLSDARNYGMEHAGGKYITFIDSDDTISPMFLEILISKAKETNADIVQCNLTLSEEALDTGTGKTFFYNNSEGLKQFLLIGKIYVAACGKLYKRELFDNIQFPYGKINEDNFTIYKVVYKSRNTICIDRSLYWHRMREGSIMHTSFGLKNMEILNVGNEIREFLKEEQYLFTEEIDYFEYRVVIGVLNYLLSSQNYKLFNPQNKYLRSKILSINKKNAYLSLKDKCINQFIKFSPFVYRLIIKKHKERKSHGVKIG